MAGKISTYLAHKLLNASLRNTAYTPPVTVYLGMLTGEPSTSDAYEEVSGGSYARQAVSFTAPADRATANVGVVTFPEATADWGRPTHWGLFDASAAGNLLWSSEMVRALDLPSGSVVSFPVGKIPVLFL